MLDDHFWPSVYPGIVVGLLVGIAAGQIVSVALGAVGGLAGAALLYFAFTWFGLQESIIALIGLLAGAVAGAYLLIRVGRWLTTLLARRA